MKADNLANLPPNTPDWILKLIEDGPHGGWFRPYRLSEGHPVLTEEWECFHECGEPFSAFDVVFVQPFHAEDETRWIATHRKCMAEALGLEDLLEMTPIERFYRGRGLDSSGRTLEVSLAMPDEEWESSHKHIQWVFPLPEPSKAQPSSPVMTAKDIAVFRDDPEIRVNVDRAVTRWMQFMEGNTHWCRERDHNHLRITRIIRFLTLIGNEDDAEQVYHTACGMMIHKGDGLPETTKGFWQEARKENPAWL